jgi:predicted RNase H-like HicB family nuclease
MRRILVIYRQEPDGWWAESPDVPGYFAVGVTRFEVEDLVSEGLPLFVGEEIVIVERPIEGDLADDLRCRVHGFGRGVSVEFNPGHNSRGSNVTTDRQTTLT